MTHPRDNPSLLPALIGDGRPLIALTGLALIGSGAFALFLSATGHFLPHDIAFLSMTSDALCKINQCRVVHFMFHDRVSFGGAIAAIGLLYLWLAAFPLVRGEAWAWWLLLLSGLTGFGSFLLYLGYGYLDTWHCVATTVLLPCFAVGLIRSRSLLQNPRGWRSLLVPGFDDPWRSRAGVGRLALLATGAGMFAAGLTISTVGATTVFVPQDLAFMGLSAAGLHAINPHLIPLIAHDRAGFGGAAATAGLLVLGCAWCGRPGRAFWQCLVLAGTIGFAAAIGVHPIIGYTDTGHLVPAYLGAMSFVTAVVLLRGMGGKAREDRD